jgi:hypothetical protein
VLYLPLPPQSKFVCNIYLPQTPRHVEQKFAAQMVLMLNGGDWIMSRSRRGSRLVSVLRFAESIAKRAATSSLTLNVAVDRPKYSLGWASILNSG